MTDNAFWQICGCIIGTGFIVASNSTFARIILLLLFAGCMAASAFGLAQS